jgi:hypothetical protein
MTRETLVLAVLAVATAAAQPKAAPPFCAIHIDVQQPNGRPVRRGVADLMNSAGVIVKSQEVSQGSVEFCDLDFGIHSVRIRTTGGCGATVIDGVRGVFGITQVLKAVLNDCSSGGDGFANGCFTYVRVKSSEGVPIPNTTITTGKSEILWHTDEYGRAQLAVPSGARKDFVFDKVGFRPDHLVLTCSSATSGTPEIYVVLEPRQ